MILPVSMNVAGVGTRGYTPGVVRAAPGAPAESADAQAVAWPQDAYLASDPTEELDASTYSPGQIVRGGSQGTSPEEQAQIEELQKRDQEVRQHEQSHVALLGPYAMGAPTYAYQVGPDGRAYAVGGSVNVDMSQDSGAPENATKAARIRMAAVGVEHPSAADMAVSGRASGAGFQAVG